ncbi:hypothetical protein PLICRDRAFT_45218 [Plicaturopsis crispa FD-325 SS-3]|uniref:F-box domain-containing protein n=1 Tax=Plicaturopsis crispa FD-325 SS-3 TaxID=944288 RepID=A0A0C9T9Z4_PLICR|nr:hypothetical protein PLICRDRAFT_45218 [Plicaturopsis crispa FD-325 SS-3]
MQPRRTSKRLQSKALATLTDAEIRNQEAPISTLPPELLSTIFEIGLGHSSDLQHKTSFPRTVAHVSRRWREVALATSALWTTVTTHTLYPSWLQSSGNRSLDVHLDLTEIESNTHIGSTRVRVITEAVTPHLHRMQFFTLFDRNSYLLINALTHLACSRVERVWISTVVDPDIAWTLPRSNGTAPLKELRVSGLGMDQCPLPLGDVTTFHFRVCETGQESLRDHQLSGMFTGFDALTTLVLEGPIIEDYDDDEWSDYKDLVHLPLVTTLAVVRSVPLDISLAQLLNTLRLPALHTLVIHYEEEDTLGEATNASQLEGLSPKFPALRTLELHAVTNPSFLKPFMHAFPDVTALVMPTATREMLLMMHIAGSWSGESWRRLRTLTIGGLRYPSREQEYQFVDDVSTLIKSAKDNGRCPEFESVRIGEKLRARGRPVGDALRYSLVSAGVDVEEVSDIEERFERLVPEAFRELGEEEEEDGDDDDDDDDDEEDAVYSHAGIW